MLAFDPSEFNIDEKHQALALQHYEIIKPLLKSPRTKIEVEARASQFSVHPTTVYRWISDFETTGTISALVPKFNECGG